MDNPFTKPIPQKEEEEEEKLPVHKESSPPAVKNEENFLLQEIGETLDLSETQKEQITQYMRKIEVGGVGLVSSPMVCKDEACPFKNKCPIKITGADMTNLVGRPCPVEGAIHRKTTSELAYSLGIDLTNEYTDAFDRRMIEDLATITILEKRALEEMSTDPEIGITSVGGFTPAGDPVDKIQLNPRILLLEKLGRLKTKIQQELLATRKSKVAALGRADDASKKAAEIMKRVQEVVSKNAERTRMNNEDIMDADFEVKK